MADSAFTQRAARAPQRHLTVRDSRISSRSLLNDSGILWIQHEGSLYQLRRTAAGKLILTK